VLRVDQLQTDQRDRYSGLDSASFADPSVPFACSRFFLFQLLLFPRYSPVWIGVDKGFLLG